MSLPILRIVAKCCGTCVKWQHGSPSICLQYTAKGLKGTSLEKYIEQFYDFHPQWYECCNPPEDIEGYVQKPDFEEFVAYFAKTCYLPKSVIQEMVEETLEIEPEIIEEPEPEIKIPFLLKREVKEDG